MRNPLKQSAWAILMGGLALSSPDLAAQAEGECELVGTNATSLAGQAFQKADAAATHEAEQAAYAEAFGHLEGEMNSGNAAVYLLAAQAKVFMNEFDEAEYYLGEFSKVAEGAACQKHIDDMEFQAWVQLYNEAINAYNAGDTGAALAAFERATEFREDARALNNEAVLHAERGETEAAVEAYQASLAIEDPEAAPEESRQAAIKGLGDLLASEGRVDDALEAYSSYLEQSPDDVVIQIRYALALTEAERAEEATAIFTDVLSRDGLTSTQWVEVGVGLYNSNRYEDATRAFVKARAANPFNKEAMENYVNSAVQVGEPDEALLSLADTLVTWYPYESASYQLKASALARADQDQEAMRFVIGADDLEVLIHWVQMADGGDGSYIVQGSLESRSGDPIEIPFEFVGTDGTVVISESLSIPSPTAGEPERFELVVTPDAPVAGFRYGQSDT